jgi:hypothetical protein
MKAGQKMNPKSKVILTLLLLASISMILVNCSHFPKEKKVALEAGFLNPPESAKPRVWWHWMNGNITKEGIKAGTQLWLDLGNVNNLAEVIVNGQSLGVIWKTPFRVNVTRALKEGANILEVKVTNLWVNRLIGDQQPGNLKKITYTSEAFYQADSPLLSSGLLGPVKIISASTN